MTTSSELMLDSSVVMSAFERKSAPAIAAIKQHGRECVRSMFVLAELKAGVLGAVTAEQRHTRQMTLDRYTTLTTSDMTHAAQAELLSDHFAGLTALCKQPDKLRVGQNDRWILAEALASEATLATCDTNLAALGERWQHHVKRSANPVTLVSS